MSASPRNTALDRSFNLLCGMLLLFGSIVFVWGGSMHPHTDATLGPVGSDEFFRNFIGHVLRHGAWERIHTGILAGPVCWALGSVGAVIALHERGEKRFSTLGLVALAMGAACWAVAFVFDGFVALRIAQAIAGDLSKDLTSLFAAFHFNQVVVIRLGLVSWILIGAGMASLGVSVLGLVGRRSALQWVIGIVGVVVGVWPAFAWMLGIFEPGPFTSRWWAPTAVVTALWFLLAGVVLLTLAVRSARLDQSGSQ